MINNRLIQRFDHLLADATALHATKVHKSNRLTSGDWVDHGLYCAWLNKSQNLLSISCGEDSHHYKSFVDIKSGGWSSNAELLVILRTVLEGAKEDYSNGFCNSVRSLIQAEVFDSELEQATELLACGYYPAAAVIAGVVLETTLRQMCDDEGIPHAKLDKMNSDLAKAGRYNMAVQKQITALADLRNKAAHGENSSFTKGDVESMIEQINRFVAERL